MPAPPLIEVLSDWLPHVDFTQTENLIGCGTIDSLDIAMIVEAIDRVYGLTLPPEEIKTANFDSIRAIEEMVSRARAAARA